MKKIIATLSVVMMMASCGNTEKAELEKATGKLYRIGKQIQCHGGRKRTVGSEM